MLDGPFDAEPDGLQEIVELPPGVAERADVADGAHRDINQTGWINKWLRGGLRLDDIVEHLARRRLAGITVEMGRVFATHPFETQVEHHLLDVGAAIQTVEEPARSPEPCRIEAEPGAHGVGAELDVFP